MKSLRTACCLIFAWYTLRCRSTISSPSHQPFPLHIPSSATCCPFVQPDHRGSDDTPQLHLKLQQCVRNSSRIIKKHWDGESESVAILTFAAPGHPSDPFSVADISRYASYQQAVVAAYAEVNGYKFKALTDAAAVDPAVTPNITTEEYCSSNSSAALYQHYGTLDYRWYKVKLLQEALDPEVGWARDAQFLVWIDADAIFLDFNLRIERLAARFEEAQLIASADIRMGLINTGVLILRNTEWVRTFLSHWWTITDRTKLCDQDAFDLLYAEYVRSDNDTIPRIENLVKILPMDAINSHPPAILHQQQHNQVLHLMGESTSMREAVFRSAFGRVCRAALSKRGHKLEEQLGLDRSTLLHIARRVYGTELKQAVKRARAMTSTLFHNSSTSELRIGRNEDVAAVRAAAMEEFQPSTALYEDLDAMSVTAHHYCDVLSALNSISNGSTEVNRFDERIDELQKHTVDEEHMLRSDIFNLTTIRINLLRERMNTTEFSLRMVWNDRKNVGDLEQLSRDFERDSAALVMLLKRKAECGNDVFLVAKSTAEKIAIAKEIEVVLYELADRVADESKEVPMHMLGLLYQNLGAVYFDWGKIEISDYLRRRHLREARKLLSASVSIFNETLRHKTDSSTIMEASYSMQLLAALTCSGLQLQLEGQQYWEQAILHAQRSTGGVRVGVLSDNYAVVLYNAAVCYTSGDGDHKDEIRSRPTPSNLKRAAELLKNVVAILHRDAAGENVIDTQRQINYRGRIQINGSSLLQLAQSLRNGVLEELKRHEDEQSFIAGAKTGKLYPHVMIPVMEQHSQRKSGSQLYKMAGVETSSGDAVQEEEELWEECSLHEDCDSFYVLSDAEPTADDEVKYVAAIIDNEEVDEDDEEERAEMQEIRERYARQSEIFAAHAHPVPANKLLYLNSSAKAPTSCASRSQLLVTELSNQLQALQEQCQALNDKLLQIQQQFSTCL